MDGLTVACSPLKGVEARAAESAGLLGALANARRLQVLCALIQFGEANVGTLVRRVGLGQSALSQHLAKMRAEGILGFRRESQTIWYRIVDPRIEALIAELDRLYGCEIRSRPRGTHP